VESGAWKAEREKKGMENVWRKEETENRRRKIKQIFIMKIEFYPQEKLKKEILAVVSRHLNLKKYKIFFFGSRVRGGNSERADIDIGLEGKKPISAKLKFQIEDELENLPTLYKFDLVDFCRVDKSFKKQALKSIEYVK